MQHLNEFCIYAFTYSPMSLPFLKLFLFKSTLCKVGKNSKPPYFVLPQKNLNCQCAVLKRLP